RLVPFIRKTPDPTIQLVRLESLERVREGRFEGTQFVDIRDLAVRGLTAADTLPLRERIARSNWRTLDRVGVHVFQERFTAIRVDRAAAYAALGVDLEASCLSS